MVDQPSQRLELPTATPLGAVVQILHVLRTVQVLVQTAQPVEQAIAEVALIGVVVVVVSALCGGDLGSRGWVLDELLGKNALGITTTDLTVEHLAIGGG